MESHWTLVRDAEGAPHAILAIDRRNAEAMINRGIALIECNEPGQAVAVITEAIGLGVKEPHSAYYNRGVARETLGDLRGAYEDYSTALAIRPDWGPAGAELARFVEGKRNRLAEVLDIAQTDHSQTEGRP